MRRFETERGGPGKLNVTCPACLGKFVVSPSWLKGYTPESGRTYLTASCPYCFKTARRRS